ncbi:unnamed protein product [Pieris brassicae]|uniref:Uncharacterized protein n=1 Tax=Pieris brassicae TaxID=7116 RepID=A0A9P0XEX6_PIEBR|nr:unnamed protein product [Pieris brassicae]
MGDEVFGPPQLPIRTESSQLGVRRHHCDAGVVDDLLHTLKHCLAWELERRHLLDVLKDDDTLDARVPVTGTKSHSTWKIIQRN